MTVTQSTEKEKTPQGVQSWKASQKASSDPQKQIRGWRDHSAGKVLAVQTKHQDLSLDPRYSGEGARGREQSKTGRAQRLEGKPF